MIWHARRTAGARAMRRPGAVLIVGPRLDWPADLMDHITRAGLATVRIDDVRLVPFFVLAGGVDAVLLDARSLGITNLVALRRAQEQSRGTAFVVVSTQAGPSDMK